MTPEIAKQLLGKNFLGPEELGALSFVAIKDAPRIPYSADILKIHASSHILIFAPRTDADSSPITLNYVRQKFGVDPEGSEPCMYNQDWYLKEDFAAKTSPDGKWHLIRKEVLENARANKPEDIEEKLKDEQFPTAITLTFTFFAWYLLKGEVLWKHDFVWCSDRDHNNDRIYVGRYEDETGVNKNGFNIHRHLSLRPAYSAAPEIMS